MRWAIICLVLTIMLTGCMSNGKPLTVQKDDHGCLINTGYSWCETKQKCTSQWEEYCPQEGESVKLMTANDCDYLDGNSVDYGNGIRCLEDEKVVGEIAGFISLHVCCVKK